MGKGSPTDLESRTPKQKRRLRSSSNRYLRPGALAQLRYTKALAAKSCRDIGKKRVAVVEAKKTEENNRVIQNKIIDENPRMLPKIFYSPKAGPVDSVKQQSLLRTPRTPPTEVFFSESRLESLPMELLVQLLCKLHHDQLKAVFHVSQRIRKAVLLARQLHFNYTTPDRSRQEMLSTMTPLPTEHWPFGRKGNGKGNQISSPHTPKAPRHGPRPPPRIKYAEVRQIAAVLFPESAFSSRYMVPSALARPICKSLASNRVLFYEEELCQAVAQNKLR